MDADERKPIISRTHADSYGSTELCNSANNSINSYSQVNDTSDPVPLKNGPQRIYKRRWYILLLFSLLGFIQNLIWNTWGPLSDSVGVAFGWTKAVVAMQTNWGCITYIISAGFYSWLMDVKGLRVSCVMTSVLIAFGSALRCITTDPQPATWLIHAGQILNGFAGPVLMAGPPLLSALWFPAYQRATATSIAILCQCFGIAGSFLIGPIMVPNTAANSNVSFDVFAVPNNMSHNVFDTRFNIMKLMYIECLFSMAILIALLIYFPDKPPSAPSISASSDRIDFKAGIRQLLRHLSFWKVSISYALALGISGIWGSLLNFYVSNLINEKEAGWLGFCGSVAAGVAGCVFSRFTDIYARHLKLILISLFLFSLGCCIVFSLECTEYIPFHRGILYSMYISTGVGVQGCSPLFYELVCETAFPIAEGLTNGIQTWLNNLVGLIFLLVFLIPSVGNSSDMHWMNWTMVAAIAVCIPILITYKESYNRLDLDTVIVPSEETPPPPPTDEEDLIRNHHVTNGVISSG